MTDAVASSRCKCLGCDFALFSDCLDLHALSSQIGVDADWSLPPAPATIDRKGRVRHRGRRGCWLLRSKGRVASESVNDHLRYLLGLLLPHREAIIAAAEGGVVAFTVRWAGTAYPNHCGPNLASDIVAGLAELRAEITITWYGGQESDTLSRGKDEDGVNPRGDYGE